MSEMQMAAGYQSVALVDRTGKGGCEFIFDGVRFTLKPGKPAIIVPRFVAEWLFRVDQQKVHTKDGQYVCRFAVTDGPDDFLEGIGPEAMDNSTIEIDTAAAEGWDAEGARGPVKTTTITLPSRPQDFAHQGGPRSGTFSGKERGAEP